MELAVINGTAVDLDPEESVADERKATAVWRHDDRDAIHHLLARGKSAYWISCWLEERYPLYVDVDEEVPSGEEPHQAPHPQMAEHRRLQLSEKAIERYRADWMPETVAGIDVVDEEIEALIGRRFPGATRWELDILEAGVHIAQHNVKVALAADDRLGLLQQTTLDATKDMSEAAARLVQVKGRLGVEGYEPVPERTVNENHNLNRTFSVELQGRIGRNGEIQPGNPEAVAIAKALLAMPTEERQEIIEAQRALERGDDE